MHQICIKYASNMHRHLIKRHTDTDTQTHTRTHAYTANRERHTYMHTFIHTKSRKIHIHAYIHTQQTKSDITYTQTHQIQRDTHTGWRRPIKRLKLHVIFCKRATDNRALLLKMSCKDRASYGSSPPCTCKPAHTPNRRQVLHTCMQTCIHT